MGTANRLTVLGIKALGHGFHADGQGLYLRIDEEGRKRWAFVFQWQGKRREMGLGPLSQVSLAEARERAGEARRLIRSGKDPIADRKGGGAYAKTFGQLAAEVIEAKSASWRNAKHKQQWANTLGEHAKRLTDKPVQDITTADVLACLKPIWSKTPETASRVRMRIENVLDAAKAHGLRSGENPAAWKGNLAHLLPPRSKLTRGHQRALDFKKAPEFMTALRGREGVAAKALEFTVLTAVRSSETLHAVWKEFDLEGRVWSVPANRTKTGNVLRVPLSDDALAVMVEMRDLQCEWVFPNAGLDGPLSTNAMSAVLERMGARDQATVHGFRSTFRDWAGETTDYPRDVVEMALGHAVGNAVERAYRRGDALEKRRALMSDWSAFLAKKIMKFS